MQYRPFGRSGFQVSAIGLGGNTFGRACDERATAAVVQRALELGINHFDCADTYGGGGVSEEYLGKALKGHRDEVVIATKTGFPLGMGPNSDGLSRRRIINNLEASLQRLGTDYVDVFYLHRPDPRTDIDESLQAVDDLVRQGKVRYAACSNYPGWQIARMVERAMARGWAVPIVSQSVFNMHARSVASDITPVLQAYGMGLVPYSPLGGGIFTGKYERGQAAPEGTRAHGNARMQRLLQDDVLGPISELEDFARQRGHSLAELAVAWLLAQPTVCSVITGVTRPEQVDQNARAFNIALDADDLAEIDLIVGQMPANLEM
jgi:aryl-alcohol dehydrogenase-like predicted oxidoreductase